MSSRVYDLNDRWDALEALTSLKEALRVALEARDQYKTWFDGAVERYQVEQSTNAELLRLLERHHKESIAENRLHPADDLLYSDTELCRETEAAIERAKEKV